MPGTCSLGGLAGPAFFERRLEHAAHLVRRRASWCLRTSDRCASASTVIRSSCTCGSFGPSLPVSASTPLAISIRPRRRRPRAATPSSNRVAAGELRRLQSRPCPAPSRRRACGSARRAAGPVRASRGTPRRPRTARAVRPLPGLARPRHGP